MAITLVQTHTGSTNSNGATFGVALGNTTTGNFIGIGIWSYIYNITGVSDGTNTYTALFSNVANNLGYHYSFFYLGNITGLTTPTITMTISGGTANAQIMAVREYSGVSTTTPIDVSAHAQSSSNGTALSSGNITTTNSADLLIGFGSISGSGYTGTQVSWGNGVQKNASQGAVMLQDYTPGSTGTYAATFTATGSSAWGAAIIALKPPTSSTPNSNFLSFM